MNPCFPSFLGAGLGRYDWLGHCFFGLFLCFCAQNLAAQQSFEQLLAKADTAIQQSAYDEAFQVYHSIEAVEEDQQIQLEQKLQRLFVLLIRKEGLARTLQGYVKVKGIERLYLLSATGAYYGYANSLEKLDAQTAILDLTDRFISSLPAQIGQYKKLQIMWLRGNRLRQLPKSMGQLLLLRELDLGFNKLDDLPQSLANLQQLQKLSLANNLLTSVPTVITQLPQLKELVLMSNQLTALPKDIGQLTKLQKLYAADNALKSLPEGISALQDLRVLDLRKNQLEQVPAAIYKLEGLKVLHLNGNNIAAEELEEARKALKDKALNHN